jgi:ligand-binding sensor domain-containing protein
MKKIFFLFLIFIFINSFSNNLYINNYPFNNSLANTKIKQIYQDHNDFLWLITNNEIYKYDGKNISDMSQNNENYFINYFFQDFSNNY